MSTFLYHIQIFTFQRTIPFSHIRSTIKKVANLFTILLKKQILRQLFDERIKIVDERKNSPNIPNTKTPSLSLMKGL